MTDYKNISLFKGLNGLRFFAAILVVMHHSETIKKKNGLANFEWLGLFRNGGNAVTFFFVLSGFLITYLLLKEQRNSGNVNVKNFYWKRILRIWPLYFLLVIIGTVGLPIIFSLLKVNYEMPYHLSQTWYYFLFFLPGLVTFFFGHHFLEPLWSIGVEEVFYLIWAPLFKRCKNRILTVLIAVILIKIVLTLLCIYFIQNELYNFLVSTFQFEAMAAGGLGAYFVFTLKKPITSLGIFKMPAQLLVFGTTLLYLTFHINIDNPVWNALFKTPILSGLFIHFLFVYVILCVSMVENSLFTLRNKSLSFLGEISYGIYMYHMLVIFSSILFLKKYLLQMGPFWCTFSFYGVVILLTILVSAVSKITFEDFFLKLRHRVLEK